VSHLRGTPANVASNLGSMQTSKWAVAADVDFSGSLVVTGLDQAGFDIPVPR
jgi:hypothetical protein